FSVYDGWDRIRASSDEIENLCLLHETEVLERRNLSFFDIRTDHFAWVANQKTVCHCAKPFAIDFGKKMVRHLFLKKNLFAIRDRPGEMRDDFPPVGFARCDHLIRAGMLDAGRLQIERVKRLIDN